MEIFTHLKLCPATAIHNFKWVKSPKYVQFQSKYIIISQIYC